MEKKSFHYINSFDVKSSWTTVLMIVLALILLGFIIYIGVIYGLTLL